MPKERHRRRPLTEEHERKIGLANSIALKGKKLLGSCKKKIETKSLKNEKSLK